MTQPSSASTPQTPSQPLRRIERPAESPESQSERASPATIHVQDRVRRSQNTSICELTDHSPSNRPRFSVRISRPSNRDSESRAAPVRITSPGVRLAAIGEQPPPPTWLSASPVDAGWPMTRFADRAQAERPGSSCQRPAGIVPSRIVPSVRIVGPAASTRPAPYPPASDLHANSSKATHSLRDRRPRHALPSR